MKNSILLLFLVALPALSSCSDERRKLPEQVYKPKAEAVTNPEDAALNEQTAVPKTLQYTYSPDGKTNDEPYNDNQNYTIDFVYAGNKIKSLTYKYSPEKINAVSKKEFTYTGDKITEVKKYSGSGKDESLLNTTTFNYGSDNKLQSWINVTPAFNTGAKYTYNADKTITVVYYDYPDDLPVDETRGTISTLKPALTYTPDAKGNIINITYKDKDNYYMDYTYTYDEKSNPFKNVSGYKWLLDNVDIFVPDLEGKSPFNNPGQLVLYKGKDQKNTTPKTQTPTITTTTYENTYDKNNIFLVKVLSKTSNNISSTSKEWTMIKIAYGSIN